MKGKVEVIRTEMIEVEVNGREFFIESMVTITADYEKTKDYNQINITTE